MNIITEFGHLVIFTLIFIGGWLGIIGGPVAVQYYLLAILFVVSAAIASADDSDDHRQG